MSLRLQFRLNYTIVESSLPSSGLKQLNPILDQAQADRQFEATFQKDCGSDDVCQSQLEVYPELELDRDGKYLPQERCPAFDLPKLAISSHFFLHHSHYSIFFLRRKRLQLTIRPKAGASHECHHN